MAGGVDISESANRGTLATLAGDCGKSSTVGLASLGTELCNRVKSRLAYTAALADDAATAVAD